MLSKTFGGIVRRQHRCRDRRRWRADRGWRWRIRCDSGGAAASRPDSASPARRDRSLFRACAGTLPARAIRTRLPGRRHQAGAKLADHFFPDLGIRVGMIDVELLEREPAGLRASLWQVTQYSVEQGPLRRGRRAVGRWSGRSSVPMPSNAIPEIVDESLHGLLASRCGRMRSSSPSACSAARWCSACSPAAERPGNTPSAKVIGVRPCLSLTSSFAPARPAA